MNKIPLAKPYITEALKENVCRVLDSGILTEGSVTHELEQLFKEFLGSKYAIAVTSCTTGLEIALRAINLGKDDEVIVPDYTFPATAFAAAMLGAKIVLVDTCRDTMLIDFHEIVKAITPRTKAIIPVSLFGNPLDYDRLYEIKKKYNLIIVEDAACSMGAEYKNKKIGNISDITVFSLHPRKFITTGEGGIITTNNKTWAEWIKAFKQFGVSQQRERDDVLFEFIGSNYKLSNVLSAIGVFQMKHIDFLLERRKNIANFYTNLLKGHKSIALPETTQYGTHSYQSFCIFIDQRNSVLQKMRERNIEVQIGTYALHQHPAFINNPNCKLMGAMPASKYVYDHCLALPIYHDLSKKNQLHIVENLLSIIDKAG